MTGAPTMTLRKAVGVLRVPDGEDYAAALAAFDWYADLIERLPKTADGVPMTHQMKAYTRVGGEEIVTLDIRLIAFDDDDGERMFGNDRWDFCPEHCYSTRAAAEEAKCG